jgi:hypothetical protein
MECLLTRIFNDNIGHSNWDRHYADVGRHGWPPGLEEYFHKFFKQLLDCDPHAVKAELGTLDVTKELRIMTYSMYERYKAHESVQSTQRGLVDMYRVQLAQSKQQIQILQDTLKRNRRHGVVYDAEELSQPLLTAQPTSQRFGGPDGYQHQLPQQSSKPPSPDVSWYSWDPTEEYVMSGALQPRALNGQEEPPRGMMFERPRSAPFPPKKASPAWQKACKKICERVQRKVKDAQVNTPSRKCNHLSTKLT